MKAEKALATLQSVPIPGLHPSVLLILSPYPPTNPPTPLPPPSAMPRVIKHLPPGITDSDLYDYFRPFGALASARAVAFGADNGLIEFWREEDAQNAEHAMHCSEIGGQTISVQIYQQRRATTEFSINAAPFVPSGSIYPYPAQVQVSCILKRNMTKSKQISILRRERIHINHQSRLAPQPFNMVQVNKFNWHR